jgi:hypothetical protein
VSLSRWEAGVRCSLDIDWPADRWREALDRAVADGMFDRAMPVRRETRAESEAGIDQRLDELGL